MEKKIMKEGVEHTGRGGLGTRDYSRSLLLFFIKVFFDFKSGGGEGGPESIIVFDINKYIILKDYVFKVSYTLSFADCFNRFRVKKCFLAQPHNVHTVYTCCSHASSIGPS